ncbi:MAG: ATP-binding cassette domain-containing protein [Urechidicola sp.]|nr:ATP-binding cassette domain-containing protein [Urechidicola sp.]
MLSVNNIDTGYGKKQVLFNLSFTLDTKEITTIVGSNGSGKSTLLRAIYGLNPIWNDGTIHFNDQNISQTPTQNLLKQGLVFIPQKGNTFESMSVLENLQTAGFIYEKSSLNDKIATTLDIVPEIKQMLKKRASDLSGGQKQQLALAMGLIHQPKLILFDEPSVGLDIKRFRQILEIIQTLNQNGVGFLLVEHRIREISQITQRFLGLKLGKLELDKTVGKNFNENEELKALFL